MHVNAMRCGAKKKVESQGPAKQKKAKSTENLAVVFSFLQVVRFGFLGRSCWIGGRKQEGNVDAAQPQAGSWLPQHTPVE
jgi:hypothetical protein